MAIRSISSNGVVKCPVSSGLSEYGSFKNAPRDPKATSAKIVMSWTSGGEVSDELMEEVSAMKMSSSEKIWYDILQKPGAEHALMAKKSGSTEPLITYIAAY